MCIRDSIGGIQAIGAMAYGTAHIGKVQKIVGPGGPYVTAAKKLVYGDVDLDMVAGPSEIAVLADETAVPAHIAADLISQLEHGTGHEKALFVTPVSYTHLFGAHHPDGRAVRHGAGADGYFVGGAT